MMRRIAFFGFVTAFAATPSLATLKPGDAAPDFTAQASLAGSVFTFSLAKALRKGPVVLYFYPAAFTKGCTIEAHAVAADTDQGIMKSYDAVLALKPEYADRVSYVIAPNGRIVYAYQSLNPEKHVANTLEALRNWVAGQKH